METFNLSDLEKAILTAADKSTKLSRFQRNRLNRILTTNLRPNAKKEITDRAMTELMAVNMLVVNNDGTVEPLFDFDELIAFLEKLIPLIITLIGLFG